MASETPATALRPDISDLALGAPHGASALDHGRALQPDRGGAATAFDRCDGVPGRHAGRTGAATSATKRHSAERATPAAATAGPSGPHRECASPTDTPDRTGASAKPASTRTNPGSRPASDPASAASATAGNRGDPAPAVATARNGSTPATTAPRATALTATPTCSLTLRHPEPHPPARVSGADEFLVQPAGATEPPIAAFFITDVQHPRLLARAPPGRS